MQAVAPLRMSLTTFAYTTLRGLIAPLSGFQAGALTSPPDPSSQYRDQCNFASLPFSVSLYQAGIMNPRYAQHSS